MRGSLKFDVNAPSGMGIPIDYYSFAFEKSTLKYWYDLLQLSELIKLWFFKITVIILH